MPESFFVSNSETKESDYYLTVSLRDGADSAGRGLQPRPKHFGHPGICLLPEYNNTLRTGLQTPSAR